ncbi:MAG: phosphotransferase [Candidatus Baltobacteraceae bacterium]
MPSTRDADPWAAELEVTATLAERSIAAQFPQLAPATARPLGEGWDNAAFLVNGAYVFRFPRRAIAAELIATECRVLPLLAGRLPLAVPDPSMPGRPSAAYPWPFAGYRLLPGVPLSALRPADDAYEALARPLGAFLRALHGLDCRALRKAGLPGDAIGRLDRERMLPKMRARLEVLENAGFTGETNLASAYLERLGPSLSATPRALAHGDLYARHILVADALVPTAIIDWGDLHFGDPAVDLSIAYAVLPPSARAAFVATYGAIDARTAELARFRAIYHSTMVAHYGYRIGDGDLIYAGLRGVRLAGADEGDYMPEAGAEGSGVGP